MDGNDYTFTLFADAQFQDGAPLTTADVAFTWTTIRSTPVSSSWGWGTAIWCWTTIRWWIRQTITIITVKEALPTPVNLGSFVIPPKHIWEAWTIPTPTPGRLSDRQAGLCLPPAYDGATGS